ncbi:MAG TPA: hypothetical protein VKD91_23240 [Pyrinomonadaceae bacterium]|nr:hypothetical protein [Pyrinomonadaceae bacterium]
MRRRGTISAILILALATQSAFRVRFTQTAYAAAPATYMVVDLDTLGGSTSYAQSINNLGQITGASTLPGDPTDPLGDPITHGCLFSNGQIIDLGTLGGYSSGAIGINDTGQVVGDSFPPGNSMAYGGFAHHAFLYSGGVMTDLGTLGGQYGSSATGINNSGQVVGQADLPSGPLRGFIYSNGVMLEIPTPTSGYTVAYANNNQGLVVRTLEPPASTAQHAFTYDSRNPPVNHPPLTDLGTLGGNFCQAISVNDSGWVAGESSLPGPPDSESLHAFASLGGGLLDLGTLPGDTFSSAAHINAFGQVVGWSAPADFGTSRGFLWSNGVMQDLNTLIPADSGWQITSANGINDLGQIVGVGVRNGQQHAVLLTAPTQSILNVGSLVLSFHLHHGIENSFLVKLQQAYAAANGGDIATACNLLSDFLNQVNAQSGKALTTSQADQLIAGANQARTAIGCQ